MFRFVLFSCLLLLPSLAAAEVRHCQAKVNGREVIVDYEPSAEQDFQVTRRESLSRWPGRVWNWAWGEPAVCNSAVLTAYLGQTLAADEIEGYCLDSAEAGGFLLVPGERNYRGRCTRTACERVTTTAQQAANLGAYIGGVALGANEAGSGLRAIAHSSGASFLLGQSGTFAGAAQAAGGALATALSAPSVLAATAATVVVVGGAVYVCAG